MKALAALLASLFILIPAARASDTDADFEMALALAAAARNRPKAEPIAPITPVAPVAPEPEIVKPAQPNAIPAASTTVSLSFTAGVQRCTGPNCPTDNAPSTGWYLGKRFGR